MLRILEDVSNSGPHMGVVDPELRQFTAGHQAGGAPLPGSELMPEPVATAWAFSRR